MYTRRVIAVSLLLMFFSAFVLSGLIYIDHEAREAELGEDMPLIELDKQRINIHVFGTMRYLDIAWLEKLTEKAKDFLVKDRMLPCSISRM